MKQWSVTHAKHTDARTDRHEGWKNIVGTMLVRRKVFLLAYLKLWIWLYSNNVQKAKYRHLRRVLGTYAGEMIISSAMKATSSTRPSRPPRPTSPTKRPKRKFGLAWLFSKNSSSSGSGHDENTTDQKTKVKQVDIDERIRGTWISLEASKIRYIRQLNLNVRGI